MHYCSLSIRDGLEHLILIILIINIIVSYDQHISIIFLCETWIPCQAVTSVLCLHLHYITVHCSTKNGFTYEITIFTLQFFAYKSACTLIFSDTRCHKIDVKDSMVYFWTYAHPSYCPSDLLARGFTCWMDFWPQRPAPPAPACPSSGDRPLSPS